MNSITPEHPANAEHVNRGKKIDKLIPWMFVGFFLVFISVDGIMATLAVKTQTGTVTEQAYETGLNYNKIIEDAKKQEKLGWSVPIAIDDQTGKISLTAQTKTGEKITGANVTATIFRPIQAGFDKDYTMAETTAGEYSVTPQYAKRGEWRVYITLSNKGQEFKTAKDFILK